MDAEKRFLFSHLRFKAMVWKLPVGAGLKSTWFWCSALNGPRVSRQVYSGGKSVNAAGFKEVQDVFTYL